MKKLNLFAAAAASVLFAACSSDAPENTGVNPEDGDMMYMAIHINSRATRATANPIEADEDSKINSVTLYITEDDADGNYKRTVYSNVATATEIESDGKNAVFQIPQITFSDLRTYAQDYESYDATKKLHLYVVCNAESTVADPFSLDLSTTVSQNIWKKGSFLMSGHDVLNLPAFQEGRDGSSRDKAWIIDENLVVDRLATRVDFKYKNDEQTYEPTADEDAAGLKFTVVGVNIFNANDNENLYPYYATSYNGTPSVLVREAGKTYWAKEPNRVNAFDEAGTGVTFNTGVYNNDAYKYICPLTNNCFTEATAAKLKDVTYVAYKVKFEVTDESSAIYTAMAAHSTIFTYKGWLLGTAADLATIEAKNFPGMDAGTANYIRGMWNLANSNSSTNAELEKYLIDNFYVDGLFSYTYETDDTTATAGYFTYYYTAIQHDKDATNDAMKYSLVRNHVYQMNLNSIKRMGLPGNYPPVDIENVIPEYWIDVTIEVNPWTLIQNDIDFK